VQVLKTYLHFFSSNADQHSTINLHAHNHTDIDGHAIRADLPDFHTILFYVL